MCNCHSYNMTPPGTAAVAEVIIELPADVDPLRENRSVCIDACIAETIRHLWDNGINTLGCCCGHNQEPPSLVVESGYQVADADRIRELIAQVDGRDWSIYKWQLTGSSQWDE